MNRPTRNRHFALMGALAATAVALAGCSSPTPPSVSASEVAPDVAGNFCDSMRIATDSANGAKAALSSLYDELANDDIFAIGADFSAVSEAGAEVVTRGNAYLDALAQASTFADANVQDDLDTISDYWKLYAVTLGQIAADSADYVAFEPLARPLIESTDTADLREAQVIAADELTAAYAAQCSS